MKKYAPVIIILIILICSFLLGILLDSGSLKNMNKEENKTIEKKSIKFYDDKEYVYLEPVNESMCVDDEKSLLLEVPYININSSFAADVNKKIHDMRDEVLNMYSDYCKNKIENLGMSYKSNILDDMLSLDITYTKDSDISHITYIFNLNDGSEMSLDEVLDNFGYTKEILNDKINLGLTEVEEVNLDELEVSYYISNDGYLSCYVPYNNELISIEIK